MRRTAGEKRPSAPSARRRGGFVGPTLEGGEELSQGRAELLALRAIERNQEPRLARDMIGDRRVHDGPPLHRPRLAGLVAREPSAPPPDARA